jgi:hypothetical protein
MMTPKSSGNGLAQTLVSAGETKKSFAGITLNRRLYKNSFVDDRTEKKIILVIVVTVT